ncbi:O-antigen ligase [Paenibacillus cellulosilyticus]|uniref:O-antigen ligase n=1 Tax=Paenibacillus cellulosilyticus TaxID=375489 RepID=A0A2V2YLY7_9BACL|nr:O-antigen ligase family protein [Paenibacillus cellulosilyticus]PWV94236.1 O-antigen ligase [Paenibacillus cellulosilyticus]
MLENGSGGRFAQGAAAGMAAVAAGTAIIHTGLYDDDAAALFSLLVVLCSAWLAIAGIWSSDHRRLEVDDSEHDQLTSAVWFSLFGLALCSLSQLAMSQSLDRAAVAEACIRWLGVIGLAGLLLYDLQRRKTTRTISITRISVLVTSGVLIGPVTIAGWFGMLPSPLSDGFLLAESDIRVASMGVRLSGFLQYPNAQGIFAAAMLLLLLAVGPARSAHPLMKLAAVSLPAPLLLTLLLAESRGAGLACIAGFAAGCLLLRGRRLAQWLASAGWASVCAALACRIALAPPAALRLAALLGCFAASAIGLAALRSRLLAEGAARPGRAIAASAMLLAAGLAALALLPPQQLYARLGAHYETAASRASLYQEALRLWREAPLLGRGGDTWRQLAGPRFGIYEVHSGYLDILLNHGLLGLSLVLLMLGALLTAIWRTGEQRLLLAPMLAMLLHAAIDFDMSYGSWWLLLFAIAGYGINAQAAQADSRSVLQAS